MISLVCELENDPGINKVRFLQMRAARDAYATYAAGESRGILALFLSSLQDRVYGSFAGRTLSRFLPCTRKYECHRDTAGKEGMLFLGDRVCRLYTYVVGCALIDQASAAGTSSSRHNSRGRLERPCLGLFFSCCP